MSLFAGKTSDSETVTSLTGGSVQRGINPEGLTVSVHGLGASIDTVIRAGEATKALLEAVGLEMGIPEGSVVWETVSVQFRCDGCGLRRPDRPGPGEGWTYAAEHDFCPACSAERGPS